MTKNEIAAVLEEIGALLELKGENPFKIRAYVNAARSIEAWGGSLSDLQDEEALGKIPGIGKSIADKIKELAATGSLKYLEELRAEFPASGRKRSKRSTTSSTSAPLSSCAKLAKPAASRNCPDSAKPRKPRSAKRSRSEQGIQATFNSGRSPAKEKHCGAISQPNRMFCRSMLREVIGDEKKLCMMSILWWPQKTRK